MPRLTRIRVAGPRLDGAKSATLIIDRAAGVLEVRPLRRRYTATVTLEWVAEVALWQRAKTIAKEKRTRKRRST